MTSKKSVLFIGIEPTKLDFSSPDFADKPGLTAEKISAGLEADIRNLTELGYDAKLCLIDLGETAESQVRQDLQAKKYDCVVIGAGIRALPSNFMLFEKLINVVHEHAPQARICFNAQAGDTAEAVQRWV